MRRFAARLALVAAGALALRVGYVLLRLRDEPLGGDSLYFSLQGRLLADGHWFVEPFRFFVDDRSVDSAVHPPVFSLFLGLASALGVDTALGHRVVACLVGTAAVVVVGLAARALAGDRAGLLAAVLAGGFPALWVNDAVVLSESMMALAAALVLLAASSYWRTPTWRRAAALSGAIALMALTRAEGALLFAFVALPLALRSVGLGTRERLQRLGVMAGTGAVVLAPWVAYNVVRFEEPVLLSTGAGVTLVSTSCDEVFYGEHIGWWSFGCIPEPSGDEESVNDRRNRETAFDYLGDHVSDVPTVMAARVGRIWGVFRPFGTTRLDGRGLNATRLAVVATWALVPVAVAGGVILRRRRRPLLPYAALVVLVTLTAALFYGNPRFRVPADVALVVLAGVALDALARTDHGRLS